MVAGSPAMRNTAAAGDGAGTAPYCCCVSIWPDQESVTGEPVKSAVGRLRREIALCALLATGFVATVLYAAAGLLVAHDSIDAAVSLAPPDEYDEDRAFATRGFVVMALFESLLVLFYLLIGFEILRAMRSRSWRPAIDAMPEFRYRRPAGGPREGCRFCRKAYGDGDRFIELPGCNHAFHERCISYRLGCAFAPRCHICGTFVRRSPPPPLPGQFIRGLAAAIGRLEMSASEPRRTNWWPEKLCSAIDGLDPAKQGRWRMGIEIALYALQISTYLLYAAGYWSLGHSGEISRKRNRRPIAVDRVADAGWFLVLCIATTVVFSFYRRGLRIRLWRPVLVTAMPVVAYVPPPLGPPELCAACKVELVAGVRVRELPGCSHLAHKGCVAGVLASGVAPRCPACRTLLSRTPPSPSPAF